ncbi:MAG TPA: hypothetical protein VJ036_07990 [bacterium]|jgi:Mg2+ and Co2+ transporter CorA|nr:hypothetical protein [bacterium]
METDQKQLITLVNTVLDTIHQQQLQTEQNNQSTLHQASAAQQDRNRLRDMRQRLVQLRTELANSDITQAAFQSYNNELGQIEGQLRQQIRETDNQITTGLQQAVAALAQVQGAMLDSQTYTSMEQMIVDIKTATRELSAQ